MVCSISSLSVLEMNYSYAWKQCPFEQCFEPELRQGLIECCRRKTCSQDSHLFVFVCLCVCATHLSALDLSATWDVEESRKHSQRSHFLSQICVANTHHSNMSFSLCCLHLISLSLSSAFLLSSRLPLCLWRLVPRSPHSISLFKLWTSQQNKWCAATVLNAAL